MKKCCDTCIHKRVCDYWEKEAYPDDYGNYDGEPCMDYFPVDVAPVIHGEWKNHITYVECSVCGAMPYSRSMFCPNCGAKMDGGNK